MMILSKNLIEAQICTMDTGAEWIDPGLFQNNFQATGLAFRCIQVKSQLLFIFIIFNNFYGLNRLTDIDNPLFPF